MTVRLLKSLALFGLIFSLLSFDHPKGWFKDGKVDKYDIGIEKGVGQNGKNAATIKSITQDQNAGAILMQNSLPGKYLNKRVKLTAYIKTKNVSDGAGLLFRVAKAPSQFLELDDMSNRLIRGTTDWTKYEIVLDIPAEATNISYGAHLSGTGQIWFDQISLDIVDITVKSTSLKSETAIIAIENADNPIDNRPVDVMVMIPAMNRTPTNLDFAEGI